MSEYYTLTNEILDTIGKLPKATRSQAYNIIGKFEFTHCADDPIYWLDRTQHVKTKEFPDGLPYVYTTDPHILYRCLICNAEVFGDRRVYHQKESHQISLVGIKALREAFQEMDTVRPFTLFSYMPPIIEAWLNSQLMVVEKSRDMMATWLFMALHTWDALFHQGRQYIMQSKDSGGSLELIQRCKSIYDNQPSFLRNEIGPVTFNQGTSKSGSLSILKQKSEILGFPQGPDQIRQYHPSGVYTDETAFQIEAAAGFAAIKPAIQMGGRYTGVSSANRSFFELLCRDKSDEE